MNKHILNTVKVLLTLFVWITGFFILNKYEYLTNFNDIDNIVGMIPVVFVIIFILGITYLLLIKHSKRNMPLTATIAVLVITSVALFPLALQGNWWINPTTYNEVEAEPDLTVFEPFSKDSKTAKLDEPSTLQISDSLPILDGATALYPVYTAFAEAVYAKESYLPQTVLCTKTGAAYKSVMSGDSDIIFVASASKKQIETAKKAGVDLKFTPIGREAFVFLAGKENPINNISYQQIRNIYSGKTATWKTLGYNDGGKIIAFQRPEGSGSQTGLQAVMKQIPIQVPQPLPDSSLIGTNSLMTQMSVKWNNAQPALGYSYKYYATVMFANPNVKLLSINGTPPTKENIQNGTYPFIGNIYAVTNGEPKGNVKLLLDWILSPQGQEIIEKTGYTSIISE